MSEHTSERRILGMVAAKAQVPYKTQNYLKLRVQRLLRNEPAA
jgi:hypothetical protein